MDYLLQFKYKDMDYLLQFKYKDMDYLLQFKYKDIDYLLQFKYKYMDCFNFDIEIWTICFGYLNSQQSFQIICSGLDKCKFYIWIKK
jgi:hypothetical protein